MSRNWGHPRAIRTMAEPPLKKERNDNESKQRVLIKINPTRLRNLWRLEWNSRRWLIGWFFAPVHGCKFLAAQNSVPRQQPARRESSCGAVAKKPERVEKVSLQPFFELAEGFSRVLQGKE